MDDILTILSAYIYRRDNAKKKSPFYIAGNTGVQTMMQFSEMINAHHMQIAEYLPPMNVAAMEWFVRELDERLRWMRVGTPRPDQSDVIDIQLPAMNLAQMEAMTELMKSRLNWMRPRGN
jgi:hypothetical protein